MIQKPADVSQPIAKILADRWSGRGYDSRVPITQEQIIAMCEAARWAPSCYGDAPWRFIIWNKFDDQDAWQKAVDCLSPGNKDWAQHAPLLVLAASVDKFSHNDNENRWSGYDTGAATINLCTQATAMGLMTHQMGGFDADKLRGIFALPDEISLWAMIAIGHPASPDDLTKEQLDRELKARERRPLTEQFYSTGWNKPLELGE
jgi:nitroreductase